MDDPKALREMGDRLKDKVPSGLSRWARKAMARPAAGHRQPGPSEAFQAGNLVKAMAQEVGGGGGGRPDMAQAGGTQPENLDKALDKVRALITG